MTSFPNEHGRYGQYGGRFIPETLAAPLQEVEAAYAALSKDNSFARELNTLLSDFVGRPTPLYYAERLTEHLGGAKIYLKREDLAHTGAHKINNAIGQALLAKRMGKTRIVAETGAGQHGVATAAACARLNLDCIVYMGEVDMERQAPNVQRMHLLGARVIGVKTGTRTLKDAISEAMRDWITEIRSTYYILGSALGPHPYPLMVRDFQSVIGREARAQILTREGRLPDQLIACVGGGSNAIGLFYDFLADTSVRMTGVEAYGAARFRNGSPGSFQGTYTYLLQDEDGQLAPTHSISAGLDYQAVGPEHAMLRETGRAQYAYATDDECLSAFKLLCKLEGIIPALESAHACAHAIQRAQTLTRDKIVIVNLSGRGDKDLALIPHSGAKP